MERALKKLKISDGSEILLDNNWYDILKNEKIYTNRTSQNYLSIYYYDYSTSKRKAITCKRKIIGSVENEIVINIDGNQRNLQLNNLKTSTSSESNLLKIPSNGKKHKGIAIIKNWKKNTYYFAKLQLNKKIYQLKCNGPIEAASKYNAMLNFFNIKYAYFNEVLPINLTKEEKTYLNKKFLTN